MTLDEATQRIKQALGEDGFLQLSDARCAVGTVVDGKRWTFGARESIAEAVALVERIAGTDTARSAPD